MLTLPQNSGNRIGFRGIPQEGGRGLDLALVLALVVLALALRIVGIGEWSFWEDEIFTIREINNSFGDLLTLDETVRTKHVLFPLLQKIFLGYLPWAGEGSYRLLAALFGVLGVFSIGLIGRSLVGRGGAILAALFMAICPWHIYWSQNNRYYTLTALLSLLTCWLFWVGLRHRRGRTLIILSFGPALLGVLAHPSSVFVLAALGAYMVRELLVKRGRQGRRNREMAWLYLALLLVGVAILASQLLSSIGTYRQAKPPNPISHLLNTLVYYKGIHLLALAAIAWWPLRLKAKDTADLLLCLTLVPLLSIFVLGFFVRVTAQYLFFTYPFYCLLAGWGGWACLSGLWQRGKGLFTHPVLATVPVLLIVLPYLAQDYLYYMHEHGWRPRWREAANYIKDRWSAADRVFVINHTPVNWYLDPVSVHRADRDYKPGEYRPVLGMHSYNFPARTDMALAENRGRTTWLVVHLPVLREADPRFEHWSRLKQAFQLERIFPASSGPKDMNLLVLSRRP